MVKSGMTRRIDELGRIVIPKEIRKNLKIKDNEEVEINVIDNKIVLNKYENINKDQIIGYLISSIKKTINRNILFTSRDKIIDYSLINKEKELNLVLNEEIMNNIESRKDIINRVNKEEIYSLFPIIINGDLYGSLIINGNDEINGQDLKIIMFSRMFLENYLE